MKKIGIDIIFPWEVGLVLIFIGLIVIIIGIKQSKKEINDFDKLIFVKPTTKIFFGGVVTIFGGIQMLSLLK